VSQREAISDLFRQSLFAENILAGGSSFSHCIIIHKTVSYTCT